MRFFVGQVVTINRRYSQHHRAIGNVSSVDRKNGRYQVCFMYVHVDAQGKMVSKQPQYHCFEEKELKPFTSFYGETYSDMKLALYDGTIEHMRKELAKYRGKSRTVYLHNELFYYIIQRSRGILRTRDTEFIMDNELQELEFRVEAD